MSGEGASRPRYSVAPLPPYSYVPGHTPHPVSDPAGHMRGHIAATVAPLQPDRWRESEPYRYGVDLFNHGYYWEAHEAWESLWHAAGRAGRIATFLKSLIKLAAACVKAREGNAVGVSRHARRSLELQQELRLAIADDATYCGIELNALKDAAQDLARNAGQLAASPAPTRLFEFVLVPGK